MKTKYEMERAAKYLAMMNLAHPGLKKITSRPDIDREWLTCKQDHAAEGVDIHQEYVEAMQDLQKPGRAREEWDRISASLLRCPECGGEIFDQNRRCYGCGLMQPTPRGSA